MRYALRILGALAAVSLFTTIGQTASFGQDRESASKTSEAELRARIKAEIKEELRREEEEKRKAQEMEEMKAMVRTLAEQQKALLDQQAKQQQPQQPKTDTQVQTASNSSSTTTTSNGPVRNIKYQIPAQWAGTAPGYVINYAGYNYIVNNDNTMTYYEGQVYYPNQNTNSVQTTPTTYYTNYPNTVVTPNTYWNGVTWVSNGYGWNGGGYWNNRARIEEARAQQQQYMFDRAVANDITSIINSAINRGR